MRSRNERSKAVFRSPSEWIAGQANKGFLTQAGDPKAQGQQTILYKHGDLSKATIKELKGGEIGLRKLATHFSETLGLESTMSHQTARRMATELKLRCHYDVTGVTGAPSVTGVPCNLRIACVAGALLKCLRRLMQCITNVMCTPVASVRWRHSVICASVSRKFCVAVCFSNGADAGVTGTLEFFPEGWGSCSRLAALQA